MTESATSPNRVRADAKALVIHASTHGHTTKIAARLGQAMHEHSIYVDLHEVTDPAIADPARYDLVVIAASIHRVHHQQAIVDWVKAHRDALAHTHTAFLSVSLSAAEDSDAARMAVQACIDEFCEDTGWTPDHIEPIAGCLQYREYDPFTRQLMRLLMKRMGHPTDASHDHDYTDWDAVDSLGRELAELAASPVATRS